MSLLVENVLGHATIQGAPVVGKRRFGVPPGGAFDPWLQQRLNARVGNSWDAPVLELALCQISLRAMENTVLAWGGGGKVSIDGALVPDSQGSDAVPKGSTVTFGMPRLVARCWVAANGGFIASTSSVLKQGDILDLDLGLPPKLVKTLKMDISGRPGAYLHAMPGPPEFRQLFKNRYTVRHDSDRVGIRLDGPRMAHTLELPSEPATPGVVQVTPEGLPIILGPDGPTIGGYPRAAVVISAEIPALSQLRPGDEIRFAPSNPKAAREAAAMLERLQETMLGTQPSPL